jgi:hypothetical protein
MARSRSRSRAKEEKVEVMEVDLTVPFKLVVDVELGVDIISVESSPFLAMTVEDEDAADRALGLQPAPSPDASSDDELGGFLGFLPPAPRAPAPRAPAPRAPAPPAPADVAPDLAELICVCGHIVVTCCEAVFDIRQQLSLLTDDLGSLEMRLHSLWILHNRVQQPPEFEDSADVA